MDSLIRRNEELRCEGERDLLGRKIHNHFALRGGALKPFCFEEDQNEEYQAPDEFPITMTRHVGVIGKGAFGVVVHVKTKEFGDVAVKSQRMRATPGLLAKFLPENSCISKLDRKWVMDCTSLCSDSDNELCCSLYDMFQEMYLAEYAGNLGVGPKVHALGIVLNRLRGCRVFNTLIYIYGTRHMYFFFWIKYEMKYMCRDFQINAFSGPNYLSWPKYKNIG